MIINKKSRILSSDNGKNRRFRQTRKSPEFDILMLETMPINRFERKKKIPLMFSVICSTSTALMSQKNLSLFHQNEKFFGSHSIKIEASGTLWHTVMRTSSKFSLKIGRYGFLFLYTGILEENLEFREEKQKKEAEKSHP